MSFCRFPTQLMAVSSLFLLVYFFFCNLKKKYDFFSFLFLFFRHRHCCRSFPFRFLRQFFFCTLPFLFVCFFFFLLARVLLPATVFFCLFVCLFLFVFPYREKFDCNKNERIKKKKLAVRRCASATRGGGRGVTPPPTHPPTPPHPLPPPHPFHGAPSKLRWWKRAADTEN